MTARAVPTGPAAADAVDPRVVRSREAVLAATVELLTECGLAGVNVEAIAQRSGVAKTTIYRHWPKSSQLVIDAVDALAEPCAEPDTGSLRGDLTAIIRGLANTLTASPMAAVIPSLVDAAERDAEIARLRREWVRQRRSSIRVALEHARRRGEIGDGVDADLVSALGAGALFYRRLVSHEPLSPKFLARVVDALLAMLGAEDAIG
jgi:AcrR family transcriptional regulator